jgi:hypothetical protein
VLKNRRTEDYLLLTERERFLWEQMDGQASLQDLGTAYVLRYGAFDFDIIPMLISKLRRAQLLTMRPASRLGGAGPQPAAAAGARSGRLHRARAHQHLQPQRSARSRGLPVGGFLLFTRPARPLRS